MMKELLPVYGRNLHDVICDAQDFSYGTPGMNKTLTRAAHYVTAHQQYRLLGCLHLLENRDAIHEPGFCACPCVMVCGLMTDADDNLKGSLNNDT